MLQAVEGLKKKLDGLQDTLTTVIKQGLDNIKTSIDQIGSAAQRTSDSAGVISRRVDNLHTEIQTLHTDIERLRSSFETTGAAADSRGDDRLLREITDLRATIEGWRADIAEARAIAEANQAQQQPELATPEQTSIGDFEELLDLAAGVAYAEISCHRDTWDFLVAQSSRGEHFRLPGAVREEDCLIDADLSGRTLIAVLDALWHTQRNSDVEPGTRRLAAKVYGRIGDALRKVETDGNIEQGQGDNEQRPPGVTRIVIDDRPPAEASS
ncbi:predicted protein [Streptomyces iranensis]|uniref:Uncharacterized protein n=1 Tax=Streptomyces iranensis TaxID=576784 RepID=A0A061A3V8_9ACTN|nr:predicted protein [Streptomyces iranensis]